MKKKFINLVKTGGGVLLLLILMLVSATQAKAQENYGLRVAGVIVTSENCNDLSVIEGVSGTVKYDAETKTLYLENATIAPEIFCSGIYIDTAGITINVAGENSVTSQDAAMAILQDNIAIKGGGTLNLESKYDCGIFFKYSLEIDNTTVNPKGKWGFGGKATGNEKLTIRNSNVKAEGTRTTFYNISSLTLDDSKLTQPEGAAFDETLHAVALNGQVVTGEVVIVKDETINYNLMIAGKYVTNKNCNDLSVIRGVEGTAKYNPETKTLYLEDTKISFTGHGIINESIDGLTINVTGEVAIVSSINNAIELNSTTTINGNGHLTAASNYSAGIFVHNSLEIDSCSVYAVGYYGILGDNDSTKNLTIHYANVTAYGQKFPLYNFASLTLDNSLISSPEGAIYDESKQLFTLNGDTITSKVVIKKDEIINYGLMLAGVDVTNKNCNDLSVIDGVSGTARYDHDTKTLYLENATIESNGNGIDNLQIDSLTINVTGENNITPEDIAICLNSNATFIKGNGILNLESNEDPGIYFFKSLEIDSCTVNTKGTWGIVGENGTSETLTINNAAVKAVGSNGSISDIASLTFKGSFIQQPNGAAFDDSLHAVVLNGQTVTDTVVIAKIINYGLKVAGFDVTNENCNDLSVIYGVSGTAKYDPETKTLFLDNATITPYRDNQGIYNDTVDGLTINVTGVNNITTNGASIVLNYNPTIIKGGGTLNAVSKILASIFFKKSLEIDSCTVYSKGKWGISGSTEVLGTLTINNADITAEGKDKGSICGLSSLTLNNCSITQPSNAAFDETVHAIAINEETVTSKVVITSERTIGIKDVKANVSARKQGIYSIDGIYLGTDFESLPKGIYIKDGKKVMK